MDPFNALCATHRLILSSIDVTQAPCTIRHSIELVRTCYHDVQHLIELRQTYLSLLEKQPFVLERVNFIISAATKELAEVCAILERCRPEEHRGRTSFLYRFQWIFFEEKEIRAHEPVMARQHASVLAELNFLRQMVLLTPMGDGKIEPGGKRKETICFDNVLLLGDLIGGTSDVELGALPAEMPSLAIKQFSQASLGVNRASLSCAELMDNAPPAYQSQPRTPAGIPVAFQDSKELDITTNSPTATEPILPKHKEADGGSITRKNIVFDPHDTAGLSLMFGGGLDFPPPSPSSSSSAWPSPSRPDTYRKEPDLPKPGPTPSDCPRTSDQSDQRAENQWRLKSQTLRWAQPAPPTAIPQHAAPKLSSQATFTSQAICPTWDFPVLLSSSLSQVNASRERTPKLAPKGEQRLSTILPGIIYDQRAADTHPSQLQNKPASATPPFLLPGIQYPPEAQPVELPGDINTQASNNPQDQQTYYAANTTLSELEASAMATSVHLF